MIHRSATVRRALTMAAVLLASAAALGFSQPPDAAPGHPSEPGVVVMPVQRDSPASKAGIARGGVILEIDDSAVSTMSDIRQGQRDGRTYLGLLLFPVGPQRSLPRPGAPSI